MSITIDNIQMHVLNMRTRFPFKYGIASLVALPHLFVRVEADVDGSPAVGVAADGLAPKWFTKNPETRFETDLVDMFEVIEKASALALGAGTADSVFDLWMKVHEAQADWADGTPYPPLLWGLGVSLVERGLIDAFCRAKGQTFGEAVRKNTLGIRLSTVHEDLGSAAPVDLLPKPLKTIDVRHTVGLADPLTGSDVAEGERPEDGLPYTLEENIQHYGLTHLKIKLCGDFEQDLDRLKQIATLMSDQPSCVFTLDGNEQYTEVEPFHALWSSIMVNKELRAFMDGLIFVEQPLHRDVALSKEVKDVLLAWDDRPPMIIDESDSGLHVAKDALETGYVGTSHKNCKGVFKGLANACLMESRRREQPNGRFELSSEDLANVGPVALLQDLAVLSTLGITHSERNGHHYFAGLSMYPEPIQVGVLEEHGTLYRRHERGFPTLDVRGGRLDIQTIVDSPFGYGIDLDTTQFTPLSDWSSDSLSL